MSRSIVAVLALLLIGIGERSGVFSAQGQSGFSVAVVRRDGVLIPFATYRSGRWSAAWPVPRQRVEAPLNFASIPSGWWGRSAPARDWMFFPLEGEPRTIHVTEPTVFTAHCMANVGLRSDYQAADPIPPPSQHHHPKDGLAITGTETIQPVEILSSEAPEWPAMLRMLRPELERGEIRMLARDPFVASMLEEAVKRPQQLERWPIALEVLCRSPWRQAGQHVYYFEASRRIQRQPGRNLGPQNCVALASQGFVRTDGRQALHLDLLVTASNCDMSDVDYGVPLGVLQIDKGFYWFMQWSGRGREAYSVLLIEPKQIKVALRVSGGSC